MGFKYIVPTIDLSVIDIFLSSPIVNEIKDDLIICADQNTYKLMDNNDKYSQYNILDMNKIVSDKYLEYNCNITKMSRFKTFRKIFLYDYLIDQGITEFHASDDDVYLFKQIPFKETTLMKDILCYTPMLRYFRHGWKKYESISKKSIFLVGNMTIKLTDDMIKIWKSTLKEFINEIHSIELPETRCKTFNFFMDTFFLNCVFNVNGNCPIHYTDKDNFFYIVSTRNKHYFSDSFNLKKIKDQNKCIAIHFAGADKQKIYDRWNNIIIQTKKEFPDVEC